MRRCSLKDASSQVEYVRFASRLPISIPARLPSPVAVGQSSQPACVIPSCIVIRERRKSRTEGFNTSPFGDTGTENTGDFGQIGRQGGRIHFSSLKRCLSSSREVSHAPPLKMWCKKPSKAGSLCRIEAASEAEEVYVTFEIRSYWRSEQLQRRSLVNAITDSSASLLSRS